VTESKSIRPALFFDRDGVVNQSPGAAYVLSWSEFAFNPGLFDLLRWVNDRDWLTIVVTSQKGVAKGLMTLADLDDIHQRMQDALIREIGSGFDAIYAYTGLPDCPHQPKPEPEMVLTAAREHCVDLSRSWLIGDADRDIGMAISAGIPHTIRVRTPENPITLDADTTVDDLAAALEFLKARA
jgi:D-glycero-D-manno-heptose 1,7-bisphosphate phosphatase